MSTDPCKNYKPTKTTDSLLLVPYGQLTFDEEGNEGGTFHSRKPHLPLNSASGLTIGRGYDVGKRTKHEVKAHLTSAGFEQNIIDEFVEAAGKWGSYKTSAQGRTDAYKHWIAPHRSIPGKTNKQVLESLEISKEAQKKLFEIIYPIYEADVVRWIYRQKSLGSELFNGVVNWSKLDPRIRVVLVDFKYRGDFFGRESKKPGAYQSQGYINKYTKEPYKKLRKLHEIIRKNSQGTDNYQEFVKIVGDPKSFPEIVAGARKRFCARKYFLENTAKDQSIQTALTVDGNFTFQQEDRSNPTPDKAYVPITNEENDKGDGSGIIIGRGFNLRTRHCYKARALRFRSHSFPKEIDKVRNEIVRPTSELKAYFAGINLPMAKVDKLIAGQAVQGKKARKYLTDNPDFPTLNNEEQKALFEMTFACYESDAILMCTNRKYLEKNEANCVNWSKLDLRIKVVLVDLCFTGDFNFISRKFLLKHLSNEETGFEEFKKAFSNPKNWTVKKFRWNKKKSSRVAVPPTKEIWDKRFKARIDYLNQETVPLMNHSGRAHSLKTLEPGTICNIEDQNIVAAPLVIPELCLLQWITKKNYVEENFVPEDDPADIPSEDVRLMAHSESLELTPTDIESTEGKDEPDPLDPEEGSDADEEPEGDPNWFASLSDLDYDLGDIYFPYPGASYKLKPASGPTDIVELVLNGERNVIKKEYRLRYQYVGENTYRYAIVKDVSGNRLTLKTKIDVSKIPGSVQVDIPFFLPLNKMGLGSLLGDALPAIDSVVSSINEVVKDIRKYVNVRRQNGKIVGIDIPLKLSLNIPRKSNDGNVKRQTLDFIWLVKFDKRGNDWVLNGDSGKFYLRFPENKKPQLLDFGIFTIVIPPRPEHEGTVTEKGSDAYFDLNRREIGFTFGTIKKTKKENIRLYFPGGMADEIKTVTAENIEKAGKKRFLLELEEFNLEDSPHSFYLRLNPEGMSVKAKVSNDKVSVQEEEELYKSVELQPKSGKNQISSRIFIVNNVIKEATVFAKMLLPGFKKLEASVEASLKQEKPGQTPSVVATIGLENNDSSSLAELDMKMLQMRLDAIRLSLAWSPHNHKWDFNAFVDGQISLTKIADIIPDLEDLKKLAAIKIENLDLKTFNLTSVSSGFNLTNVPTINILDGLFTCGFDDLKINWKFDKDKKSSLSGTFVCNNCNFRFNRPSVMDVEVHVGKLNVDVDFKDGKFRIKTPSAIGLSVKIGEAVHFAGELGWVDEDGSRYFFASGTVRIEGFPNIRALLKMGSLEKNNGERAVNFVLYAETDLEMELFPGIVLKRIGGGIGVNNRLSALDSTPNEREIIENIDKIQPHKISSWAEVKENGLYVSIIASAMLASNRGNDKAFNAYVMHLILSLDTNLDIIAAGKLWLASSVGYISKQENYNRPALVGALVLSARQHRLGVELRSRKNPAIESNDLLRTILNKTTTRLAFRLTPELVDYHLQEISYRDRILGVSVGIAGNYRVAAFRRALLAKAGIHLWGHFDRTFRAGPGGFTCNGNLDFRAEYGGLISLNGIDLYGSVSANLGFHVSAFIRIGFRISFKIFGKRITKSFYKTFRVTLSRVQLGFHGAIAMRDIGKVGFDGHISISISICGHRLSIRPHLSFNGGLINSVRNKISAFERLLDQYGEQASFTEKMAPMSFAALSEGSRLLTTSKPVHIQAPKNTEAWLHYRSLTKNKDGENIYRHAYLPSAESTWFTPFRDETLLKKFSENFDPSSQSIDELFKNDVQKIAVGLQDPVEILQAHGDNKPNPSILKVKLEKFTFTSKDKGKPVVITSEISKLQNIWYIQDTKNEALLLTLDFNSQNPSVPTQEINMTKPAKLAKPDKVLYSPWSTRHAEYFGLLKEQIEEIQELFLESTIDENYPEEIDEGPVEVIYDPRVESPSKEFMSQEAQMLPEDVLSAHFVSSAQNVNLNTIGRDELAMIEKYEQVYKEIIKEERHTAFDPDPEEQKKQMRAQVVNAIIGDFNGISSDQETIFRVHKKENGVEFFGFITEELADNSELNEEEEVFVQRNDQLLRADLTAPDKSALDPKNRSDALVEKMQLLKIRQDYIQPSIQNEESASQNTSDPEGKVVVSLPIKINSELFNSNQLSKIGSFRLYKIQNEDELKLVAEDLQPNFYKRTIVKNIQQGEVSYAKQGELNLSDEIHGLLGAGEEGNYEGELLEVLLTSQQGQKASLFTFDPKGGVLLGDASKLQAGNYQYVIRSKKTQYLVPPFFYRDIISETEAREGALVSYYLEAMPTAFDQDNDVKKEASGLMHWGSENLYIPKKADLPEQMAIVFAVDSLVLQSSKQGQFLLLEGEKQEVWDKAGEFELWVKELPLQQNGFYAGDTDFQSSTDVNEALINELSVEQQYESTDGKQKIERKSLEDGKYAIQSAGSYRSDCSYQFYIGFKQRGEERLLPMQHYVVKSFPKKWDQVKYRVVNQIEWIPSQAYHSVSSREMNELSIDKFFTNSIFKFNRNFIETNFQFSDVNLGGMELFFVDLDEPGFTRRQYSEVLAHSAYVEKLKDFREASQWRTPFWSMQALKGQFYNDPSSKFKDKALKPVEIYYNDQSKLIVDIKAKIEELKSILSKEYNWRLMYQYGLELIEQIHQFQKSSLDIQHTDTTEVIEQIQRYLINLFLGIEHDRHFYPLDESQLEKALKTELDNYEAALEKASEEDDQAFDNEGQNERAIDRKWARHLFGNLQRRLAVVYDFLQKRPVQELPKSQKMDQLSEDNQLLPGLGFWVSICEEYQNLQEITKCPFTLKLFEIFIGKGVVSGTDLSKVKQRINNTKVELKKALVAFEKLFNRSTNSEYQKALSKVLPAAKDVSLVMDLLELAAHKQGSRVIKQRHHSVVVDTSSAPHTPVKTTKLAHFLPDNVRLVDRKEVQVSETNSSHDRYMVPFFNLMDYLGFSVDIQWKSKLQKPLDQDSMVKQINQVSRPVNSLPFILRSTVPNSLGMDSALNGFSFVKVALLPEQLFAQTSTSTWSITATNSSEHLAMIKKEVPGFAGKMFVTAENILLGVTSSKIISIGSHDWDINDQYFIELQAGEKFQSFDIENIEKEDGKFTIFNLNESIDLEWDIEKLRAYTYKVENLYQLLEHRGIEFDQQNTQHQKYFAFVAYQLEQFMRETPGSQIPEIYIEEVSNRWQTLPAWAQNSKSIWQVPDQLGHRYFVAMRSVSRYEPLINWHLSRHDLTPLKPMDALKAFMRLVRVKPVEYGFERNNQEQMLLTYNYPHPNKAYFSYQLPVDAARAMKNQIASVRTGYKGHDLVFHHELIDDNKIKIQDVLSEMKRSDSNMKVVRNSDYDEKIQRVAPEPEVRLFDHERMLTLSDLQYYHKFRMNVRTLYDSHSLAKKLKGGAPEISATVEPSNLFTFEQDISLRVDGEDLIYDFTIFLSRHIDNLTVSELVNEPKSLAVREHGHEFQGRDLPDLSSVYHIYWRVDKKDGSKSYYIPVTSVHMPWSEGHGDKVALPIIKDTNSKFSILNVGPTNTTPEDSQESQVPIEYMVLNSTQNQALYKVEKDHFEARTEGNDYKVPDQFFNYKVQFTLKIAKKDSVDIDLYHEPSKFALQIARSQFLASKVDFTKPQTIGVES